MHAVPAETVEKSAQDAALNYRVMAAFMESGRLFDRASSLLVIAASLICLFGAPAGWPAASVLAFHLGMALAAKYYGWRVALDAELFTVLARHAGDEQAFDRALAACSGRNTVIGRSPRSRWEGARRLLHLQLALLALQAVATIATALLLPLAG